jgi:hypothetical protein
VGSRPAGRKRSGAFGVRLAECCHGCPESKESVELADICPPPPESPPRHAPSPPQADWCAGNACEDARCEELGQGETIADLSMPAGPSKGALRGSRARAALGCPMMRESVKGTPFLGNDESSRLRLQSWAVTFNAVTFVESSSTANTPKRACQSEWTRGAVAPTHHICTCLTSVRHCSERHRGGSAETQGRERTNQVSLEPVR